MAPKSDPIVSIKVRVRKGLRRRLEAEARRRGCSVNYEVMSRLERSFESENVRRLDEIAWDMGLNWVRFSNQLTCNDLGEKLVQAIIQTEDLRQIKVLAHAWLATRQTAAKEIDRREALMRMQAKSQVGPSEP